MKNMLKKTVALVLALALCLSFAGCYSENNTWAAKLGDDTMPIGGYIYYLSTAYNEAAMKISSDIEVLDGEVAASPPRSGLKTGPWTTSTAPTTWRPSSRSWARSSPRMRRPSRLHHQLHLGLLPDRL